MRKILITIVIVLLGFLSYNLVMNGIELGSIKVGSISSVKALSDELDKKINEATEVTTITFNNTSQDLNNALKELTEQKEKYENKIKNMTEEEVNRISQKQVYEVETIWVKLGKYAKQNGVILKLDITSGNSGDARDKNLKFTVSGSYIGITDFVYDIEDDDDWNFRIENFKLVPAENTLQGEFTVRNIGVNLQNGIRAAEQQTNADDTNNTDADADTTQQDTNEQ